MQPFTCWTIFGETWKYISIFPTLLWRKWFKFSWKIWISISYTINTPCVAGSSGARVLIQLSRYIPVLARIYFKEGHKLDLVGRCRLTTISSQRTHGAIMTSLIRQNDVATAFWVNNDVSIALFVRWDDCYQWNNTGTARLWTRDQHWD